jgi:hypothetical protein
VVETRFRLYLSASGETGEAARRLLQGLERAGHTFSWSQIGNEPYASIGPAIVASDAVVALVNHVWVGSTYHAMEISYALGDQSYEGQPPLGSPRPVFTYLEDESWLVERHWIQRELLAGRVIRLPPDPDDAGAVITAVLRHAKSPPPPPSVATVRELLPIGEMTPERYVALHGHAWLAASMFSYRYPEDSEVDQFCLRVTALLKEHEHWDELRREWLSPEEYAQVQEAERWFAENLL